MSHHQTIAGHIAHQAKALQQLSTSLSGSIDDLVDRILGLEGRVILAGLGKSGHIARKVAATLSSTGTPSLFLHPAEGLHGDLGMITPQDLVILISKSGENPELNLMMPTLRQLGVFSVAVTSNPASSLAQNTDHLIDLGEVEEICPLDLAPTTSATLTLVLLDSLAMALMQARDFKAENYALFHPGGRLGRRLLFSVEDTMDSLDKVPVISPNDNMKSLLHGMTRGAMGAVLVCDEDMIFRGLVTDYDIRNALESFPDILSTPLSAVINSSPSTCGPKENAYEVLVGMRQRQRPISLIPVVESGRAVGLLRLETMVQQGLT